MPDPDYNEQLRLECARGLIDGNLEEAASIAETLKVSHLRSKFYREASDTLPKTERARKLDLLDKALLHARTETNLVRKLDELGMIGYRLLDLGETERGTKVLREGQRLADTLPKFVVGQRNSNLTHGRGLFAAKLARIDAAAALKLAEGYSNTFGEWYIGGIALGLADRDPAGSERVFGMLKNQGLRDQKVIRAAGRMAAIDRERARRLAESLERPLDQALALESMAPAWPTPIPRPPRR